MKKPALLASSLALALASVCAQAADLIQLYQIAKGQDPQWRASQAQYQAGQQEEDIAFSDWLPQVSANASVGTFVSQTDQTDRNSGNSLGTGINLTQLIYDRAAQVRQRLAEQKMNEASLQLAVAEQDLIFRLAEAYFNVLRAQDNLAFRLAEEEALKRQWQQTEQRFELGLVAITERYDARAGYDQAIAETINARNGVSVAFEQLEVSLGQKPKSLLPLNLHAPILKLDAGQMDEWLQNAKDANLALALARLREQQAQNELKLVKAGHYPRVDLLAGYNYESEQQTFEDFRQASARVQVTVPLYTGGRVSAQSRQAAYALSASSLELLQTERATNRDIRSGYLDFNAAKSSLSAFLQAEKSSASALEATQEGYEVGTRNAVDLLLATGNYYLALRNSANARYDLIINWLQLQLAAGTLSEQSLKQVNAWLGVNNG